MEVMASTGHFLFKGGKLSVHFLPGCPPGQGSIHMVGSVGRHDLYVSAHPRVLLPCHHQLVIQSTVQRGGKPRCCSSVIADGAHGQHGPLKGW